MPKDNQIPEKYTCPITCQIMIDPVMAADGHDYEREAIEQWLLKNDRSPKTNEILEDKKLRSNHGRRNDILEFLDARPELYDSKEIYLPQSWVSQCIAAIKGNQCEELQKLLNKDRRLLTIELEGDSTALHLACEFSSPDLVDTLLENLRKRDESITMIHGTVGFNPIHLNVLLARALNRGIYSKCELLLKLGAEIEQPEAITQNTLLHRMVIQGIQGPVEWLLEQKAVLESRNSEGNTPLLLSVIQDHIKLTKFLLKMNANLEVVNVQEKAPFYIAVEKSNIEMAKLLLENGADPAVSCGAVQLTTLHLAAGRGDEIMLQYLLDTKAISGINAQDARGNTALHLAIQAGHDKLIRTLLEAGASHAVKNLEKKTPIELANKWQKKKILPLIIQIVHGLEFKATEEERIREAEHFKDTVRDQRQSLKVIQPENKQPIFSKSIQAEKSEQLLSACFNVNVAHVPDVNQKDIEEFLQFIADGKKIKAKAILKRNPDLVLLAGDVTDPYKCAFMDTPWKSVKTLFIAAHVGHVEAIIAVSKAGIALDTPDNYGFTAVHVAAGQGNVLALEALKSAGANMDLSMPNGATPIYFAAQKGHAEVIRVLKAAGANVNMSMPNGETPVHVAAQLGHVAAITALKAAGANVNTPDNYRVTPVYMAAQQGQAEAITALKAGGANVDTPDNLGGTPVFAAAAKGHAAAIAALKTAGANMNTPNDVGITPLHIAAQEGHVAAIAALKAAGAVVDTSKSILHGFTPLHIAAQNGRVETIIALRAAGANVNSTNQNGQTPICIASQEGRTEAILALKSVGAHVDAPDDDGRTPIYMAAKNGHAGAIAALAASKANVNMPGKDGATPVYVAAFHGHVSAIKALKAAGAAMNIPNNNGFTPIYAAAYQGHTAAINALVNAGIDVNQSNSHGFTEVHIAAQNGHAAVITALKATGANVNISKPDGTTPIHIAAYDGHVATINALINAGADMNISDCNGFTEIHLAAQNGHATAITVLKAAGANVDMPIWNGITPIYLAAQQGHVAAIAALKAAGANVNVLMPDGATPVLVAAQNGHAAAITALKAAGAAINKPLKDNGITPIYMAAQQGHAAAIAALKAAGANVNSLNSNGATPVHIAAQKGHAAAITALRAAGADMDMPFEDDGRTAVYMAAQNGHPAVITALKAAGANVDMPAKNGLTPVHSAAKNGHPSAIIALKAAGAAIDTPLDNGITPIYLAAENGHTAAITALKTVGANADIRNNDGFTAVFIAAQNGHVAAITALATAGANVNTPAKDGSTPIHIAAQNGHAEAITVLKTAGADMNKPTLHGAMPIHMAARAGYAEVITELKAAGADVDRRAGNGTTSLCIAAENGHTAAITALLEAGADAGIKTSHGTALEAVKKREGLKYKEVVRLLEAHFKQYPNGIKSVDKINKVDVLAVPKKVKDNTRLSSVEEKDNKENLRFTLEKLRTLFLNEGNLDVKSENVETYNECLKNINNNAQLVYKKSQNKHVLYVNDFVLTNEAAVKAIEKMMQALEETSAEPLGDAIGHTVNVSYQYEDNDIQAILSARLKQLQVQNPKLFIKPIKELGAVDDMTGFELRNRLAAEAKNKTDARICLIPCNLGNAHWVGMLLELDKGGEVLRAQYIDSFTTHAIVPEIFQAQLQSVYPKAQFQTLALLQQSDNNSCGAYTIENLLIVALGIQSPKESENIRLMHLECLKEYNPIFYQAFDERQRNNRPTTAAIHEQLGYLEGLKNIWFSKAELNRILALKECLSNLPPKIQTAILEVFKHKPAYNDDHALHLNTIRSVLQKAIQLEPKALTEMMQLLFEAWNPNSPLSLDKMKFRASYNEILAVSERHLVPAEINNLQKTLAEQIKQDEEFARKLQLELWSSVEMPEMNKDALAADMKAQMEFLECGIPKEPAPGGPHELMFSHQTFLSSTRVNTTEEVPSPESSNDKDIEEFLNCIAAGKQVEAKAILKRNPALGSLAGEVTDLSEHTFMKTPWKSIKTIFIAAERGNVGAISALNKAGVPVETRNNVGITPLYIAAKKGWAAAITALVTAGANVNTPRDDGATPILVAAQNGHAAVMVALLEAGADASIKTKWGTALEMAQKGKKPGNSKVVSLLETHFKQYPNGIKQAMNKQGSDKPHFSDIKTRLEPLVLHTIAVAAPDSDSKDIEEFLTCIAEGEQAKAKAILKRNPGLEEQMRAHAKAEATRLKKNSTLLSLMGEVTDLPKHTFRETPWKSLKTLFIAVEKGHIGAINALIRAGVPVNKPNSVGVTPVFIAAENGHAKAITLLKAAGADVNRLDKLGRPAINAAAQNGHAEAIAALKAAGADVNRPFHGYTPVSAAAENGHVEAIAALKAAGANMDTPDDRGITPVSLAAQNGHADAITALKKAGANVDNPDKESWTPISVAADKGHTQVISALIKAGAKVNTPMPNGATPVWIAAQNGHAEVIFLLKAAGANVNTPRKDGYTPVYMAAQHGHAEAITALKAAGAAMSTLDREGFTPVHIAAQKGHAAAIHALKAAGATMDMLCNGTTPVHMAAQYGHAGAITALKTAGAAMNTRCNGATPVFMAAQNGHVDAITALKAAGADVNMLCEGVTPIWVAAQNGHLRAITALKDAGANVNAPDNEGCTPVFIAAKKGQAAAITVLVSAGANVNIPNKDGITPICVAAMLDDAATIAALKAAGADMTFSAKLISQVEDIAGKACGVRLNLRDTKWDVSMLFQSNGSKPTSKTEGGEAEDSVRSQIEVLVDAQEKPISKSRDALRFPHEFSTSGARPNPSTADMPNINPKDIQEFLTLVVEGEQEKAELMLKGNSSLALASGDVTDLSKRTFTGITGFQYAVWALDWHMWTMIRKYLPEADAKEQAQGFETGSWVKSHGVHANLNNLIQAYQTTIYLYKAQKWAEGDKAWVQQVGGGQLLLPTHVINEYCHPTRPFYPLPNFKDALALPRSRSISGGEWFTACGGKLGKAFAVYPVGRAMMPSCSELACMLGSGVIDVLGTDCDGIRALVSARTAQREELIMQLNSRNTQREAAASVEKLNLSEQKNSPESNMLAQFQVFVKPASRINASDLTAFLRFVAEGEQEKAEAMLKHNPALGLAPGDVTDLSKRTFTSITGFQYAVWALDWHMWTMIRKYLPDDEAKKQAQEFETGAWVKSHDIHAQKLLDNLVKAYQMTRKVFDATEGAEADEVWVQQVGGAQRLLPAHVVNEFCHPTRRFSYPMPNFKDTTVFPRSRIIDKGEWFTTLHNGGKLGEKFAVYRAGPGLAWAIDNPESGDNEDSIRILANIRMVQRAELISELKAKIAQKKVA